VETVVDEICDRLKICPLEFRLRNAARAGTRRVDGVAYPRIGLVETLEAIRASEHWRSRVESQGSRVEGQTAASTNSPSTLDPEPSTRIGRGLACGYWFNAGLKSSVTATINADGKVSLVEGSTDIGGTRTSVAMQLAETLGIPAEDVNPVVADTDGVGYTDVTGGSRVTHTTGMAAYEAGMKLRHLLCERAAAIWNVAAGDVAYEDGHVYGPEGKRFTFQELAARIPHTGEPISAAATVSARSAGGAFATHLVDIAVDSAT
jgi:CO/xanthine dehydrogenase Mo-binding subunit